MAAMLLLAALTLTGCLSWSPDHKTTVYNYEMPKIPDTIVGSQTANTSALAGSSSHMALSRLNTSQDSSSWFDQVFNWIAEINRRVNVATDSMAKNQVSLLRQAWDSRPPTVNLPGVWSPHLESVNLSYEALTDGLYDAKIIAKNPRLGNRTVAVLETSTSVPGWRYTVLLGWAGNDGYYFASHNYVWQVIYEETPEGHHAISYIWELAPFTDGTVHSHASFADVLETSNQVRSYVTGAEKRLDDGMTWTHTYRALFNKAKPEIPTTMAAVFDNGPELAALFNKSDHWISRDLVVTDELIQSSYPDYPLISDVRNIQGPDPASLANVHFDMDTLQLMQ